MQWSNLKNNRCPRDNSYLAIESRFARCKCGFFMGLEKLGRIATDETLREISRRKEKIKEIEREQAEANFEFNERRFRN